jgi:hypothetical protein
MILVKLYSNSFSGCKQINAKFHETLNILIFIFIGDDDSYGRREWIELGDPHAPVDVNDEGDQVAPIPLDDRLCGCAGVAFSRTF